MTNRDQLYERAVRASVLKGLAGKWGEGANIVRRWWAWHDRRHAQPKYTEPELARQSQKNAV